MHPEPIFFAQDLNRTPVRTLPDFIIYWENGEWVYEAPFSGKGPYKSDEGPAEWPQFGWTISLNYSDIPAYPCGICDAPAHYDYLCSKCRDNDGD